MQKKRILILTLAGIMVMGSAFPTFAAKKKKISSVSLEVNTESLMESEMGNEEIEIEARSDKYYVDTYEIMNEEMEWSMDSIPEIEITLMAEDGYYFAVTKRSDVKLKGNAEPEYVSGRKRDSSSTLIIRTKLHCIQQGVGELETDWDKERPCTVSWESTYDGNSYEVRLERYGRRTGVVQEVSGIDKSIDLSNMMKRAGNYTAFVREINPDSGKKSEWFETESYNLPEEIAQKNKDLYGYQSLDSYGWKQDNNGWWYNTPGGYKKNEWLQSNDHWFFMDENGYMVTGWREIGGNWYYFNDIGEMLSDTVTPDGYTVNAEGVCIN